MRPARSGTPGSHSSAGNFPRLPDTPQPKGTPPSRSPQLFLRALNCFCFGQTNVQRVSVDHGGNLNFSNGRFGYSNRTSLPTSDDSCVHFSFNSGHRRDGSNLGVGQQLLRARGGIGHQQQQQHDSWNRHQPQFVVHKQDFRPPLRQQHNQQNLPRYQQRSPYHRPQYFHPLWQHPHQRGGPKSGPGGPWDCGQNAAYYQEEEPVPANAPMGAIHKCSRCGRYGPLASICGAPLRFEGNCAACRD